MVEAYYLFCSYNMKTPLLKVLCSLVTEHVLAKNLGSLDSLIIISCEFKKAFTSDPTIFFLISSIYISEKLYLLLFTSSTSTFPFEKKNIFFSKVIKHI